MKKEKMNMILPEIINQHLKEYSIEKNEGEIILFWQPHNENLSVNKTNKNELLIKLNDIMNLEIGSLISYN